MANTTGKKHGGRKKGTPNKKTQELQESAERLGVNVGEYLLLCVLGDRRKLGYEDREVIRQRNHARAIEQYERDLEEYEDLPPDRRKRKKRPEHPGELIKLTAAEIKEMNMLTPQERADRAEQLMPYFHGKRRPIDKEGNTGLGELEDILNSIDG